MVAKIGYLDANGHPHIHIKIWGMSKDLAQEFEAMIDTGFTGFLSMPITAAFPLAIALFGTTSYTLADGSLSPKLLGFGNVEFEGEIAVGTIVLEPNSVGLLVGMEFLRKLEKALLVSKVGVVLVDEAALAVPTPPPQPPPTPANTAVAKTNS